MCGKVKEIYIWLVAILVFVLCRLFLGERDGADIIVGVMFAVCSVYWILVPFILGKDMAVPGYPTATLKKGKDDFWRVLTFAIGCYMYALAIGVA